MSQVTEAASAARGVAVNALLDFESTAEYADEILSKWLDESSLQGNDRALAADLYWGVIRWRGRLDGVIQQTFNGDYTRANPLIRILLRLGGYQLYVQDRVPDHAAVSQTVEVAVHRVGKPAAGLINAILRKLARERERWEQVDEQQDELGRLCQLYSHPRWIAKHLREIFGPDELPRVLECNNKRSPHSVRINGTADRVDHTRAELRSAGIKFQPSSLLPNYIRVGAGSLNALREFLDRGDVTVQDESAGLAVELLAPERGDAVLDLCAAPGGKTLAILDKLQGTGTVVANELSPERAGVLQKNLERVSAHAVTTTIGDARQFPDSQFDKVLVDAPCSALGLLRRQPDVRWRRRSHHVPTHTREQLEILRRAAELVKPGGILVYSTCSILPAENRDIVVQFLKEFPEFQTEDARGPLPESVVTTHGEMQTYTHVHDCDGAYAARLRRIT